MSFFMQHFSFISKIKFGLMALLLQITLTEKRHTIKTTTKSKIN